MVYKLIALTLTTYFWTIFGFWSQGLEAGESSAFLTVIDPRWATTHWLLDSFLGSTTTGVASTISHLQSPELRTGSPELLTTQLTRVSVNFANFGETLLYDGVATGFGGTSRRRRSSRAFQMIRRIGQTPPFSGRLRYIAGRPVQATAHGQTLRESFGSENDISMRKWGNIENFEPRRVKSKLPSVNYADGHFRSRVLDRSK